MIEKISFYEAENKICPYLGRNCITEGCMFWKTTNKGKKEIDRKVEPYDMTPMGIARWSKNLQRDGYINVGRCDGFRDQYVKYKEVNEGFCSVGRKYETKRT